MANDIPADWYPDAHGTIRWWDGTQWTDHVRGEAARPATSPVTSAAETSVLSNADTAGAMAAATATQAATSAERTAVTYPRSAPTTVTSRVIYPINPEADEEEADDDHSATRRIVLTATAVGLAAFFLGMGMGGRNQAPQALPSPEPTPVVVTDSPELDQRAADLDERESQLKDREDELNKRATDLDNRKAELDRRALETPTPTPTPSDTATATSIDGEETVLVGTDVRSGSYRTNGPSDTELECEYTISRDSSGSDVVDEGSTNGSATVSLRNGEYFDSDNCEDWSRE
jgi:hypothetical protein